MTKTCRILFVNCDTAAIEGALIRQRSAKAVVASLTQWRAAGFRRIFFVDNVFNLPEGYARALCDRITAARHHLPRPRE